MPEGPGAFYPATVLSDVPEGARVLHEETFGPVAPIVTVGSFDEGLERAASRDYGLAASVLTSSQANVHRAWRELPVGTVKVNSVSGVRPAVRLTPTA